jgi:glycosyltransferase involved in cell wall biosynthesis
MGLVDGESALIRDEPAAFAAAIDELYQNGALWEKLRANALIHVERHFSTPRVKRTMDEVFHDLGIST